MIVKSAQELHQIATAIFRSVGADPDPTRILVDHLIAANLAGHDSHGVILIPMYVRGIKEGRIQPNAQPALVRDRGVAALVDGNWTFGQVTALYATHLAIERATSNGVALVGAIRCNHIGRLGTYATHAARQGVAFMITTGTLGSAVAPHGGRAGALSTNPFSFGFPAGESADLMVDFATSAVAGGKVLVARAKHEHVPPGCLIDKNGNPTTDPNDFFDGGALLPFGGHKGYGLSVLSVLLSQVLLGSWESSDFGAMTGTFILAIDTGLFRDRSAVAAETDRVFAQIKEVPPAAGFHQVVMPGEPELRTSRQRAEHGIPIAEDTWAELVATARDVGLNVD